MKIRCIHSIVINTAVTVLYKVMFLFLIFWCVVIRAMAVLHSVVVFGLGDRDEGWGVYHNFLLDRGVCRFFGFCANVFAVIF